MKKVLVFVAAGLVSASLAAEPAEWKKCVACHGADGKKTSFGNDVIAGMAKDQIVQDLKGYRAKTLDKHGKAKANMFVQAAKLTDAQIEELATYISGLAK